VDSGQWSVVSIQKAAEGAVGSGPDVMTKIPDY